MKKTSVWASKIIPLLVISFIALAGCNESEEKAEKEETDKPKANVAFTEQKGMTEAFSFDPLPEVVATVNGSKIEKSLLEKIYTVMSKQSMMAAQKKSDEEIVQIALKELISAELLKQESKRQKITPAPEKIDEKLESIKVRFPTAEAFEKTIKENGMDMETLKAEIKNQLALEELLAREIESKVTVKDEEISKFYTENPDYFKSEESVKASHILVKSEEGADEAKVAEAKKKIEKVLAEVKKGADFAAAAKQYSEGPSGPNGGDLGFFSRGQMVPPFEEKAFALKKGQISDIVKTKFGFHIIKVVDKKEGGITPLSEVKESITAFLSKAEKEKLFNAYVEKLRSSAAISKNI